MKGPKNKSPVLPMAAVIIPGLIICTLALVLVSKQENARLLDVRRDFTTLLNRTGTAVEAETGRLVEEVFAVAAPKPEQLKQSQKILAYTRNILLQHPIVKYPFFISSSKGFLFPVSQAAQLPAHRSPTLDSALVIRSESAWVQRNYLKAYDLEYKEKKLTQAVKSYLSCLKQGTSLALAPYLYNSVARCYYKLRQYRQALAYYNKSLSNYPRLQTKDPLLYFTLLRQQAVSFKQTGAPHQAAAVYLRIYEEILAQRGKAGAGPFAFYKNEALDFLNSRDNEAEVSAGRFNRAKALDQLDNASELDISLRWLYFEAAARHPLEKTAAENTAQPSTAVRFLKLRELYESDNEKTRFYNQVKSTLAQTGSFNDPVTRQTHRVFSRPLTVTGPELGTVYFGFMLSMEHVKREIIPSAAQAQLNREDVIAAVKGLAQAPYENNLISMPMGPLFPGRELSLYAHSPDLFQGIVRKDIRLYYILLAALVLTLTAGIFVFYKYIAREAQLVRLKSRFVDSASHTLKTPLTRMSLLAENVVQGWVKDEKQKEEFFQAIVDETARMSEMIENMLNFSRIESGKQHYQPQPVNPAEITTEVIDHYRVYARNLGFQLETRISPEIPILNLDPGALRLIIGNLLHNAVKYSAQEKFISIALYCEANRVNGQPGHRVNGPPGHRVCLEIKDRGIGIEEKNLKLLFRKFSRVPDDRVKAAEGSGLGLYLVKHAVEAHNGQVSVTSQPNIGTTFLICFPVED